MNVLMARFIVLYWMAADPGEGSAMQRVWRTVTGFYHVCARGTGKQLIFEGDEDRWEFLELMRECCRKAGVTVIAWCLWVITCVWCLQITRTR